MKQRDGGGERILFLKLFLHEKQSLFAFLKMIEFEKLENQTSKRVAD